MLNDEQLKTVFISVVFVAIIIQCIIILYSKKKGVNIEDNKFQLKLGLSTGAVIIFVFWFSEDIGLISKLKITAVGFAVGIGTFFTVDRLGKKTRKTLNIETSCDKERNRKEENDKDSENSVE